MTGARIDYVELPSATAHELTRAFYAKAFGWAFTDYGPSYSATTNGTWTSGSMASRPKRFPRLAGDSRRGSRGGVRRGIQGRRNHRQADLQLPRRPALPLHRSRREASSRCGASASARFPSTGARRRDRRRCRPRDHCRDRSRGRRCSQARCGRASASAGCSRAAAGGRHGDVRIRAGARQVVQSICVAERVARSRHWARSLRNERDTGVLRAGAVRAGAEIAWIAVVAGRLGEQRTHIVAGPSRRIKGVPSANHGQMHCRRP